MQIISHRGYWLEDFEKNTQIAFERSFSLSFGTETDVRDHNGDLVISHDPPSGGEITLKELLSIFAHSKARYSKLALNIKADGLSNLLAENLKEFPGLRYFLFDMSVPEMLRCKNSGLNFYTRVSEYENVPILFEDADGLWVDSFERMWFDQKILMQWLEKKDVCLVSPELHKRSYLEFWQWLKSNDLHKEDRLALCTDFPEEAQGYFYGKN